MYIAIMHIVRKFKWEHVNTQECIVKVLCVCIWSLGSLIVYIHIIFGKEKFSTEQFHDLWERILNSGEVCIC